jgi:hypothetical protein
MGKHAAISAVLFICFASANAKDAQRYSRNNNDYYPATVLNVRQHQMQSNYVGGSATDAPLQSSVFAYDVSLHLDCGTYVGRYQTPFNSLPAVLTPNSEVDVRLQKHVMYVDVPGSREYRMSIVGPPHGQASGCQQSH